GTGSSGGVSSTSSLCTGGRCSISPRHRSWSAACCWRCGRGATDAIPPSGGRATGPLRMTAEELLAEPGRLDVVVTELTGAPRADVQRAIADGRVRVDGRTRPKSFRLGGGERLLVDLPQDEALVPDDRPVPIRYEDEDLVVVAKPAGVVTHPTAGRRAGTLVNRLMGMGVRLSTLGGPLRAGIVHRLDAGTRGLM